MKQILCMIAALVVIGVIVGYIASHRPDIRRNEANGPTNVHRFKGYKASLHTPINRGTPHYGEAHERGRSA